MMLFQKSEKVSINRDVEQSVRFSFYKSMNSKDDKVLARTCSKNNDFRGRSRSGAQLGRGLPGRIRGGGYYKHMQKVGKQKSESRVWSSLTSDAQSAVADLGLL